MRETLSLMQKLFPVRQCENSVYNNRSRPCLQYQIGRCSAPCVPGYVTDEEYNQQVELARLFFTRKRSASIRLSHWQNGAGEPRLGF